MSPFAVPAAYLTANNVALVNTAGCYLSCAGWYNVAQGASSIQAWEMFELREATGYAPSITLRSPTHNKYIGISSTGSIICQRSAPTADERFDLVNLGTGVAIRNALHAKLLSCTTSNVVETRDDSDDVSIEDG